MDGLQGTHSMEMLVEFLKNFLGETILLLVCLFLYMFMRRKTCHFEYDFFFKNLFTFQVLKAEVMICLNQ